MVAAPEVNRRRAHRSWDRRRWILSYGLLTFGASSRRSQSTPSAAIIRVPAPGRRVSVPDGSSNPRTARSPAHGRPWLWGMGQALLEAPPWTPPLAAGPPPASAIIFVPRSTLTRPDSTSTSSVEDRVNGPLGQGASAYRAGRCPRRDRQRVYTRQTVYRSSNCPSPSSTPLLGTPDGEARRHCWAQPQAARSHMTMTTPSQRQPPAKADLRMAGSPPQPWLRRGRPAAAAAVFFRPLALVKNRQPGDLAADLGRSAFALPAVA